MVLHDVNKCLLFAAIYAAGISIEFQKYNSSNLLVVQNTCIKQFNYSGSMVKIDATL